MCKKFLTVANQQVKVVINLEHVIVGITYCTGKDAEGVGGKCLELELQNGKFYLIGTKAAILEYTDGRANNSRDYKIVLDTEESTEEVITAWETATC